jgi:uncharacterized protein (TIGR03435 family)
MIPNHLSATWTALAPALGNHLWQSTLFASIAGLLTLALRKNHARVRYWVWLAASVRFLIPFSLLVGIGSCLPWSCHAAGTKAGLYIAMEEVSQPFTQPTMPMVPQGIASAGLTHLVPAILAAVWLCRFLVVIFQWHFRWRRISAAIRKLVRLEAGREVQALRRLERIGGMRKGTEMLLSRTSLEPGIFGIIRPVLVWPEGISERLEDAHLEVILAHELCHVRRRDNLAAALHMLVEAIFWFHPLVWWLEGRLMEERERACDEEVLESGSDRQVYAESILKICEFCVGSPLACVSGVTGADLKKRIARIMTGGFVRKLDFSRKLLLSTLALAAIALPILFGPLEATPARAESQPQSTGAIAPAFEVASIKRNNGTPMAGFSIVGKPFSGITWNADRFMATNVTLHGLIRRAYDVQDDQIRGGPDWLNSEGYDLDAKAEKSVVDEVQKLGPDQLVLQLRRMLQALLADRFKLSLHDESKEVPVYALVIAENGLKIQRAIPGDTYANGFKRPDGVPIGWGDWSEPGKFFGQGVPIASLVQHLSEHYLHRSVLDKTGLTDKYDFALHWTPSESQTALFTAIQEQLGLKLESQKGPMKILVIDHAEKPAESLAQNPAAISPVSEAVSPKPNKPDNPPVGINSQSQNTAAGAPAFDTVSIKPHKSGDELFKMMFEKDGFSAIMVTLRMLIRTAYGVDDSRIFGAPNWLDPEKYDVEARMENSVAIRLGEMSEDQLNVERRRMLQALLADRFKLTLHRQTTQLGVYVLVVAKNGPKLQEAKPGDTYPNGLKDPEGGSPAGIFRLGRFQGGRGELVGQGLSMAKLLRLLSEDILNRSVIDNTGLTGNYDFTLEWKIGDESQGPMFKETGDYPQVTGSTPLPEFSRPSFFNAIQEQLGLKLESQNSPGVVLVIDHVERPSEN